MDENVENAVKIRPSQRASRRTKRRATKRERCPICNENDVEISMPCAGMHSYCFSCIKSWTMSAKKMTCPSCRKTCEHIIKLPVSKEKITTEFSKFLESVKIIPNPKRHDEDCTCFQTYFDNTCIYPYWSMIHFIENKDKLDFYYEVIKCDKFRNDPTTPIKHIKWFVITEDDGDGDEDKSHNHTHEHNHSHANVHVRHRSHSH